MYGKFGCGVTHEQAVEEFNGGKTVVQIARKYGITTKEVKTILGKAKSKRRKKRRKPSKPNAVLFVVERIASGAITHTVSVAFLVV